MDRFAAAGHPTYAITLPDHDRPGDHRRIWATLGRYVDAVGEALDDLGPDCVVVGHSMGGFVVQHCLMRRRVGRAVLLASIPHHGVARLTASLLGRDPAATLRGVLTLSLWPLVSSPARARQALFRSGTSAAIVEATHRRLQNESYVAFLGLLAWWPRPRRNRSPVSVVVGGQDHLFDVAGQRRLAAAYGAELTMLPRSGHDAMLDDNWQQSADLVQRAIDG